MLFITIGDSDNEVTQKMNKFVDFNNSTIFLNISKNYTRTRNYYGSLKMIGEVNDRKKKSELTDIQDLKALIANMSNIKIIDDNLIYEKF